MKILKKNICAFILGLLFIVSAQAANEQHLVFKNQTLHIHAQFLTTPQEGVDSVLQLEAHDASTHKLVDLADQVEVVLWMPSMGHGSSPTHVERLDVGTFRVSNVFFIMPGEWEVRVTLTDDKGQSETKSFKISID